MEARRIIRVRADASEWIARLSGKELVCNCRRREDGCWAWLLRSEFMELLNPDGDEEQCMDDIPDEDVGEPEDMTFEE